DCDLARVVMVVRVVCRQLRVPRLPAGFRDPFPPDCGDDLLICGINRLPGGRGARCLTGDRGEEATALGRRDRRMSRLQRVDADRVDRHVVAEKGRHERLSRGVPPGDQIVLAWWNSTDDRKVPTGG